MKKAQDARIQKHLDSLINVPGIGTMSRREFLEKAHRMGAKIRVFRERQYDKEEKLSTTLDRMANRVPLGNPNHPETVEFLKLHEQLKAGIFKERTMLGVGDRYYELSKTELDYFNGLT